MMADDVLSIGIETSASERWHSEDLLIDLMEELCGIRGLPISTNEEGAPPAGSKSVASSWAEILITLGAAGALLPTALGVVRDWLLRQPPTTTLRLKLKDMDFEFSGTTPPQQIEAAVAKLINSQR